jgi:hypothetical protein
MATWNKLWVLREQPGAAAMSSGQDVPEEDKRGEDGHQHTPIDQVELKAVAKPLNSLWTGVNGG